MNMLTKLMLGTALTAMVATMAQAQSFTPSAGSGNIVAPPNSPYSGPDMPGYSRQGRLVANPDLVNGAYAYAPPRHHRYVEPQ